MNMEQITYHPDRYLPPVPVFIRVGGGQPKVRLEIDDGEPTFKFADDPRLREPMTSQEIYERALSGWSAAQIQEHFMGIRSVDAAFHFLSQCYAFLWPIPRQREAAWSYELRWSDFQTWQRFVAELATHDPIIYIPPGKVGNRRFKGAGPYWPEPLLPLPHELSLIFLNAPESTKKWMRGIPSNISFTEKTNHESKPIPAMEVITDSAIDAILASLYFARISTVKFQKCKLADCKRIYELTSAHHRKYCSPEHAHLGAQKDRRNNARKKSKGLSKND